MKKILFCLPLLLLALQSCEIEDEYMYDKGLYTIDWDAAADSSSVTLIDRFWNTEENYFNYGNDGSIKDFHYWPQAHAMDVKKVEQIDMNGFKVDEIHQYYKGICPACSKED